MSLSGTARRDALIREHLGLVRYTVERVGGALPDDVDAGDLAGHGVAELIEAAGEYGGKARGFGAYAKARVWRRVTGFVREQAWYREVLRPRAWTSPPGPLSTRGEGETATAHEEAVCAVMAVEAKGFLEGTATSPPGPLSTRGEGETATAHDEAVCAVMAVEAKGFLEGTATSPPGPLSTRGEGETATAGDRGGDRRATGPDGQPAARLAERIAALPELERIVLGLWFQEELSLQEIGEVLEMEMVEVKAAFARGGASVRQPTG